MAGFDLHRLADREGGSLVVDVQSDLMFPQFIAALPRAVLGPPVGSLAHERDRIRDALDMALLGF